MAPLLFTFSIFLVDSGLQYSDILLVHSPFLHLLLLLATQYYSGTHSRGETALPTSNGLLFLISRSAFLPGFLLLTEFLYCVTGDIKCNKQDLKIVSNVTQYDDHKSSDFLLSIWECGKFDIRGANWNKECWYCEICINEYNIWNSTKSLMHLTISGGHSIARCRGEILHKYQRQFKALKEKKNIQESKGIKKRSLAYICPFQCSGHINRFSLKEKQKGIWYLF